MIRFLTLVIIGSSFAFAQDKDLGVPIENEILRLENAIRTAKENAKSDQIKRLSQLYMMNSRCSDVLALRAKYQDQVDQTVNCICTKGDASGCTQIEQIGLFFQLQKLMREQKVFSQANLAIFMNDLENLNEARYQMVKYYHNTEEQIPAKYKKRIIQWEKELQTY